MPDTLDAVAKKFPSYCCQHCGACIGYVGRAVDPIYRALGLPLHQCSERRAEARRPGDIAYVWFLIGIVLGGLVL